MMWDYWLTLYLETHSAARGLRTSTIAAYRATLEGFRRYVRFRLEDKSPDKITAADALGYVEYLRRERDNGDSAVNRQVTILKNFYRAIVAMGHLEPSANPMAHFPKVKAAPRKIPVHLSQDEVKRMLSAPPDDTILGLRDRAILLLIYGTGIRASECARLRECDIDFASRTIFVVGKGGHERTLPLSKEVAQALALYRRVRGSLKHTEGFFRSRRGRIMSRGAVYERVRKYGRLAKVQKRVSPHVLRHTFATHLVRKGIGIVTISKLLGHRLVTSTQVYLHTTAEDLREAAEKHPIRDMVDKVVELLPDIKLPFQKSRRQKYG
jgi:site-specific recombinase XerD